MGLEVIRSGRFLGFQITGFQSVASFTHFWLCWERIMQAGSWEVG